MKELVKVGDKNGEIRTRDLLVVSFQQIIVGLMGFVASRGVILGGLMPFGISFMAGCPSLYIPSVAIGTFAGYFIPAMGSSGFRYIAAMLSVLAIKLLLSSYKKIVENPFFLSLIALLSTAMTSVVTLSGIAFDTLNFIAETLLAAGGTYFVARTSQSLSRKFLGLSGDEMVSLLIVISMVLIGLSGIGIYDVSVGRAVGILLILTSAKYGGTLSGAVSGIAVSFSAALAGSSPSVYGIYAFAGMMAGIFSTLSKYAQLLAFWASCLIGVAIGNFEEEYLFFIVEIILGSLLFLIIPRNAGITLGKIFSCQARQVAPIGLKKAVTLRLNQASAALSDVSQTVEQVSAELSKINSPDYSRVLKNIEKDCCVGCKLRVHCWQTKREDTLNGILDMTKAVKEGNFTPENYANEEFKGRCLRLRRIGESVYRRYSDYAVALSAENRIEEVRSVVSDQFDGISNMLYDLAYDFESDDKFDSATALNAATALKNLNIRVEECSSRIDKFGRMTLEMKLQRDGETVINKLKIMKLLSAVCDRDLDVPTVITAGKETFISITEKAYYTVDIGVHQISAQTTLCGDAYKYFNDGKGHFVMILSDGMGTGGRAAVDGAMASGLMARLINAGFGYNCSLRILNSSMLFKSTDESLATLDIASIDLFTGETELYKAGAAPSVVRRQGKTGKAESTSLPIGILREIGFDRAAVKIRVGDIIVLMSDGATNDGVDWIRAELECWKDGSAQDLSEHLCQSAQKRRSDNHKDDITVMVAILEKAV